MKEYKIQKNRPHPVTGRTWSETATAEQIEAMKNVGLIPRVWSIVGEVPQPTERPTPLTRNTEADSAASKNHPTAPTAKG